jgi:hypothetical protein
MRRLVAIGLAAFLVAGCGGEGGGLLRAGVDQVTARVSPGRAAQGQPAAARAAAAPAGITREDLEAAGVPVLRLRLQVGGSPRGTLFFAAGDNGGVTSYATPLREIVGMRGSQVVSTRGLGTDLLRGWSSQGDPLALPVPPAEWPAGVTRTYEVAEPALAGPRGRMVQVECSFAFGEETTITILTAEYRGVQVTESCIGEDVAFQNLHFVEGATGRVWRSLQWTGPRQGLVDVEILVPR